MTEKKPRKKSTRIQAAETLAAPLPAPASTFWDRLLRRLAGLRGR